MIKAIQFLVLLYCLVIHAQTGWYQQISGTENYLLGVHFTDVNTGTVVGIYGTILRTTDGGKTWVARNSGISNEHLFDVHFIDANIGIVVSILGNILRTTNGGETWTSQINGVISAINSVFFADENNGTAVGHTGIILRTTDGGITWSQLPDAPTTLRSVHFADVNNGFAVGDNGLVMRTTDGGASWFQQYSGLQVNLQGVWLTDSNTAIVVGGSNLTGARIYRTTDGGSTWMLKHSIQNEVLSDVHFIDSQTGTAVGWNGIILRTTDGGESWESQNSNTNNGLTSVFFVNSEIGYAVGNVGTIVATMDGGIPVELTSFTASVKGDEVTLNWSTASEINNKGFKIERLQYSKITRFQNWDTIGFVEGSGTTTEVQEYSFIDKNMKPGVYSYRLKQIDFDGTFEYSKDIEAEVISLSEFSLEQNYPNPFNPSTKISWQSPVSSHQVLKVFDVLGNEVASLVDEYKPAGSYEVEFDGSSHSSGTYFYRLQAGEYIETKKLVLLK